MKPDELADADSIDLTITARFIQEAESVFVQMPSESLRVKHIHGVTLEVKALADAYLARESEQPAIPNHKSGMPLPMTPATWRSLLLNLRHRSDPEAWAICQLCCYLLDRETNGGE